MANIAPFALQQFFDNNGDPLSGGKLYTYESGTSTPKVTYTTADEATPNTNPIILDSAGRANIWLDTGAYTFKLDDANDVTIDTVDDITSGAVSTDFAGAVTEVSVNTNITLASRNQVYNATTTPISLLLLDVATATEGFAFIARNSGSGDLTIDPDGSELIDGQSTKVISPEGSLVVVCTGTAWITFSENFGDTNSLDMTFTGANTHSGDSTFSGNNTLSGNNSFTGNNTFSKKVAFLDDGELTISGGAITLTGVNHTIDTEADASTDDLDTINGMADGQIAILRIEDDGRNVVIKDGTGNIETPDGKDIELDTTTQQITIMYDATLSKVLVLSTDVTFGKLIDRQVFLASDTWTKPAGTRAVIVTVIGGGGGAGTAPAGTDGGTSSFGAHCSATGGLASAAGGLGSNGDQNIGGETGGYGFITYGAPNTGYAGNGGNSIWGGGGKGAIRLASGGAGTIYGESGKNPGGGAGGYVNWNLATLTLVAGAGAGGTAIKYITSGLGVTETVTVGAGGNGNSLGGGGQVIVESYT